MNLNLKNAISINNEQIGYCLIHKKGNNYTLKSLAYYDFKDENEFQEIVESINEAIPKGTLTNVSISHTNIIEHIYFYKQDIENIKSKVYKDLKTDYEIDLHDYLIDYEEVVLENKKTVFVVAIAKDVFKTYISSLENCSNIKMFSLETHTISLRRLLRVFSDKNTNLCFSMMRDSSSIFAISNGTILVERKVKYGWGQLILDIAKEGGIDEDRARAILDTNGLEIKENPSQEERMIYDSVSQAFDKFSIEIQRTMDYLTSVKKVGAVNNIVLIGHANNIKKSDIYLSKLFSLKVKKLEIEKLIEFDSNVDFSVAEKMLHFPALIGAALRDVK